MAQDSLPTNQYTYQPLSEGEFRLLELHAGEYGSPISISLEPLPLDALSGAYEALSYVWGTSPERLKITCDEAHLHVTSSLYQALQCLRLPAETRVLWVDAVCIDQESNEEKSQQVCLMGNIYHQALGVIVWLGEPDDTSRLAMATLTSWERFAVQNLSQRHYLDIIGAKEKFQAQFCESPDFEASKAAISNFLCRPWFSRTWTFQEIVLSRTATFHCGEDEIGLAAIYASYYAVRLCRLETPLFPEIFPPNIVARILTLEDRRLDLDNFRNLAGLLALTQDLESTDPRDKIYGLFGLARTSDKSPFVPRYDISVSAAYALFTVASIKDDNELYVLMATDRESSSDELPSWVPDWRQRSRTRTPENPKGANYNISPYITPSFQDLEVRQSHELVLGGAYVDSISETYFVMDLYDEIFDWNGWDFGTLIASFVQDLALPHIYAWTGEAILDVIFRVLTVDQGFWSSRTDIGDKRHVYRGHLEGIPLSDLEQVNQRGYPSPPSPSARLDTYALPKTILSCVPYLKEGVRLSSAAASRYVVYQALYSTLFGGRSSTMFVPPEILFDYHSQDGRDYEDEEKMIAEIAIEAKQMIHHFCKNRCIFVTQRGYIGLGSDVIQKGDLVCVLFGSTMPFVLRSVGTAEAERFILRGVSYVHGIMDGELWRKRDDGEVEPVEGVELRSFTLV